MSSNVDKNAKDNQTKRQALVDQLQFLGQMTSTETALFHQTAAAKYGLGITDMKTISTLMQEGAMTAGQIAVRLSLTTGAVTNVIDRLERRGVVQRQPDAHDRRKVIVSARAEALHAGKNVYESMGQASAKRLASYTTTELEFLVRYHQEMLEMTKHEIAKLAEHNQKHS